MTCRYVGTLVRVCHVVLWLPFNWKWVFHTMLSVPLEHAVLLIERQNHAILSDCVLTELFLFHAWMRHVQATTTPITQIMSLKDKGIYFSQQGGFPGNFPSIVQIIGNKPSHNLYVYKHKHTITLKLTTYRHKVVFSHQHK